MSAARRGPQRRPQGASRPGRPPCQRDTSGSARPASVDACRQAQSPEAGDALPGCPPSPADGPPESFIAAQPFEVLYEVALEQLALATSDERATAAEWAEDRGLLEMLSGDGNLLPGLALDRALRRLHKRIANQLFLHDEIEATVKANLAPARERDELAIGACNFLLRGGFERGVAG